jgi:hypothetical protein
MRGEAPGQRLRQRPFYLYGAFTVDLDACTIVDDRNATLVVENIEIERERASAAREP